MKKTLGVLLAVSMLFVAIAGQWPPVAAVASVNAIRFLQSDGTPFPNGTTISITAHGTSSPIIASGTTDSNGNLVPSPTLTQGAEYDFTSSFSSVPNGAFFAQSPRVTTVVVAGGGSTTLPCPSPGANITVSGTYPCTISAGGGGSLSTPNVAGNISVTASPGPYTLIVSTPSPAPGNCIGVSGTWPYTVGYTCASPTPAASPIAGNCIGVSGLAAPFTIAYSCASPTPEPSPIAGSNVTVSGLSAPYTISAITPTPAPTPSPVAANCIAVSGLYPYTLAYSCASPTPEPSPIAGSNITVSGLSAPYTISATTPTPAPTSSPIAGTGIGISGLYPYTISCTGCSGGSGGISAYDQTGASLSGFHIVQMSGTLPSSTSTTCATGGAAVYCNVVTLGTSAQFTSGGSTTAPPSFECGGQWYYYSSLNAYISVTSASFSSSSYISVRIVRGTPNTIYVTSSVASIQYVISCEGN